MVLKITSTAMWSYLIVCYSCLVRTGGSQFEWAANWFAAHRAPVAGGYVVACCSSSGGIPFCHSSLLVHFIATNQHTLFWSGCYHSVLPIFWYHNFVNEFDMSTLLRMWTVQGDFAIRTYDSRVDATFESQAVSCGSSWLINLVVLLSCQIILSARVSNQLLVIEACNQVEERYFVIATHDELDGLASLWATVPVCAGCVRFCTQETRYVLQLAGIEFLQCNNQWLGETKVLEMVRSLASACQWCRLYRLLGFPSIRKGSADRSERSDVKGFA